MSFSFGTTSSNIVIDNCESVVEVIISIIGDNLIQLLTQQSNLYHCQKCTKMERLTKNSDVVQYHT